MEAKQEKEMIRSLQPVSGNKYQRDEKKRGKEGGHFHLCMYWTIIIIIMDNNHFFRHP